MPVAGRKPKPMGMSRNRAKLVHEWTEVLNVPFRHPPSLPKATAAAARRAPDPVRPLGQDIGLPMWGRIWARPGSKGLDEEAVLVLCEQMDERVRLRVSVMHHGDWHERAALRYLEGQIVDGLGEIQTRLVEQSDKSYPPATRRWWKAVSHMPHCFLWDNADWQFAFDTADVAAEFHRGNMRFATELRNREQRMGTTADARRNLRIRYVTDQGDILDDEATSSVTAMDAYRKAVS